MNHARMETDAMRAVAADQKYRNRQSTFAKFATSNVTATIRTMALSCAKRRGAILLAESREMFSAAAAVKAWTARESAIDEEPPRGALRALECALLVEANEGLKEGIAVQ